MIRKGIEEKSLKFLSGSKIFWASTGGGGRVKDTLHGTHAGRDGREEKDTAHDARCAGEEDRGGEGGGAGNQRAR